MEILKKIWNFLFGSRKEEPIVLEEIKEEIKEEIQEVVKPQRAEHCTSTSLRKMPGDTNLNFLANSDDIYGSPIVLILNGIKRSLLFSLSHYK